MHALCVLLVASCCVVGAGLDSALARAPTAAREKSNAGPLNEATVRARADALLGQMTAKEKAGQLSQYFHYNGFAPTDPRVASGEAGSVAFVADPVELNRLQRIAMTQSRLRIPLLVGFDLIHGFRTIFPVPIGMAASWDPVLVEEAQTIAAAEARAVGIHWTFAPNVDIARDPRWGRMVEGAGEDPFLGAAMARAQVRGFQGAYIGAPGHIISGPKHFAGYGAVLGGRDFDEVNLSDNELWNVYLPPFKAAIDAGAGNIMSAYMGLNGIPAAGNRWLLTDVLRNELGFKGFVVGDNRSVRALATQGLAADISDAAVRALKAGVDMEMNLMTDTAAMQSLPEALAAGKIKQVELDNSVRLVLEAKIRMGLFENPYVDEAAAGRVLEDPTHLKLARVAAERAAVLLRNEGGVLPLDRKKLGSVAVIGPLADAPRETLGPWTFPHAKPVGSSLLKSIRDKLGAAVRVDYSEGVRMPPRTFPSPFAMMEPKDERPPLDETTEIGRAVALARSADVAVLVIGEGQNMAGESASRSSLDLPGRQRELLDAVVSTGKPVVVLLMSARPLDLEDSKAAAIMDVWYPGSGGGEAVANLLFGDAVPGGKLPFSWIRSASHAPNPYAHLISHEPANEDKRYWNETSAPTYPFGHGLSYTTFKYANLHVATPVVAPGAPVEIAVDLSNTGARTGDETAQLYIHQRYGTAARPVRELKGFQRVTLKPGETRTIRFTLHPEDLRYWNQLTRSWVQDAAPFDIWVGGSSAATLSGNFEVIGSS
jgi:beta-glucosidase